MIVMEALMKQECAMDALTQIMMDSIYRVVHAALLIVMMVMI